MGSDFDKGRDMAQRGETPRQYAPRDVHDSFAQKISEQNAQRNHKTEMASINQPNQHVKDLCNGERNNKKDPSLSFEEPKKELGFFWSVAIWIGVACIIGANQEDEAEKAPEPTPIVRTTPVTQSAGLFNCRAEGGKLTLTYDPLRGYHNNGSPIGEYDTFRHPTSGVVFDLGTIAKGAKNCNDALSQLKSAKALHELQLGR